MSLYTISRAQVAEIYIATFDRAPDTYGLIYWTEKSGLTIEEIAESFFGQPETKAKYPDAMDNTQFVKTIYNNVFDRDADPAGLAYWVDELNSGSIDRADMIIAIVNGAFGTDQIILDHKTEVGLYFAENGEDLTIDQAYEIMQDITVAPTSVTEALQKIDGWAMSGPITDLTIYIDHIEGSDIDSMINGLVDTASSEKTTLNAEDIIDGGGGSDTLKVKVIGGGDTYTTIAHMSNVEKLMIDNAATADQTFDLSGTSGLESIVITGSGNLTLTSSEAGSAKVIDGSVSTGNLTIKAGVISTSGATITGGSGVDNMTAGAGQDIFKFAKSGDTGITLETADSIISFAGADKISFNGMAAGNSINFDKAGAEVASFDIAKIAAEKAFANEDTEVVYSYQSDGKDGYLFVDRESDGTADEVVILVGLGLDDIVFGDIA